MTTAIPTAPYTFDREQDTLIVQHFSKDPFWAQAFDEYLALSKSTGYKVLEDRIYVALSLDLKRAIENKTVALPEMLLGDDLTARLKVIFSELFTNQDLIERIKLDKPRFQQALDSFFSNLIDDKKFKHLRALHEHYAILHYQGLDETVHPGSHLVPRIQVRPQLNLRRYIHQQEEARYKELSKSPFMANTDPLVRHHAILAQIQEELEQNDPQKIEEYIKYVKDYQAGKINVYETEEARLRSAGFFYDDFATKLNETFSINIFSIMVWIGDDGKPNYDFRQTPKWSLAKNHRKETMEKLEAMLVNVVEDQFGPEGTGMNIGRKKNRPPVDSKSPHPPPIPKDLHRLPRKDLCSSLRDYFKTVADWQGEGLKSDLIPWARLKNDGPGGIFLNHTRCIPASVTLAALDDMSKGQLQAWYNRLIQLEEEDEIPIVFVDDLLKAPRNLPKPSVSQRAIGRKPQDTGEGDTEDETSSDESTDEETTIFPKPCLPSWFDYRTYLPLPQSDSQSSPTASPNVSSTFVVDGLGIDSPAATVPQHVPPAVPSSSTDDLASPALSVNEDQPPISTPHDLPGSFPSGTLSGRAQKPGPLVRIPPGSPRKRQAGSKRKSKALESRDTEGLRRTRARLQQKNGNSTEWKQSEKTSLFTWAVQEPLESIAREGYLDKTCVKKLPEPVQVDYRKVVEEVHALDELIGGVNPKTFSVPEFSDAPESLNLWVRGCNSGKYLDVDERFIEAHYEALGSWIGRLKFGQVNDMSEEEIIKEQCFQPGGQGLSHVLWALRIWLEGHRSFRENDRLPDLVAVTFAGIHNLTTRIKGSTRL
ncbi:hypothetical protein K435DRAFT_868420 [Dendrothele bispora CBS 962.96]|uniref:Uncharacterized protein n=1 Tax=Dendrothele bispora (strain CBS 962.96) TaxID=1314807 RepID=A0A4S8LBT7_DENBC|nr:hypothetical protein K435DRAFT_868420 [Dendrothele bispora CBS 962.96]